MRNRVSEQIHVEQRRRQRERESTGQCALLNQAGGCRDHREREREQSGGKRAGEKTQRNNWIIINVLSSSNRAQAEH